MTLKTTKRLHLLLLILAGIIFIYTLIDENPGTLFGSVWFLRLGMLALTIIAFVNYNKLKKKTNGDS